MNDTVLIVPGVNVEEYKLGLLIEILFLLLNKTEKVKRMKV